MWKIAFNFNLKNEISHRQDVEEKTARLVPKIRWELCNELEKTACAYRKCDKRSFNFIYMGFRIRHQHPFERSLRSARTLTAYDFRSKCDETITHRVARLPKNSRKEFAAAHSKRKRAHTEEKNEKRIRINQFGCTSSSSSSFRNRFRSHFFGLMVWVLVFLLSIVSFFIIIIRLLSLTRSHAHSVSLEHFRSLLSSHI